MGNAFEPSLPTLLRKFADNETAQVLANFFKTGPGDYGEGDRFLGTRVPTLRKLAKEYHTLLDLNQLQQSIHSKWHEERMLALLILLEQYQSSGDPVEHHDAYNFYTKNLQYVNNWDLVDLTAPHIVGHYLYNYGGQEVLAEWSESEHLWTRRVAVLASFHFLRQGIYSYTLNLVKSLLNDQHDLIHKACGWMLREVGKRDINALEKFLDKHAEAMPRTMLRYSLEKFPKERRSYYMLKKKI